MRDAIGVLLVAIGVGWTVIARDKAGLVVAFAGVTLLAYGVLHVDSRRSDDRPDPPVL